MKHLYLTAVAMLLGISATASAPRLLTLADGPRTDTPSRTELQRMHRHAQNPANLTRPATAPAPVTVAADADPSAIEGISIITPDIVYDQPAGDAQAYSRDCNGYWSLYGRIYTAQDFGGAVNIVKAENSDEVWLSNPISLYACKGWTKGKIGQDGTITLSGAQKVHREYFDGADHDFYMVPMEFRVLNPDDNSGWWYPVDKEVTYTLENGVYKLANPQLIYGFCQINAEGTAWEWMGYGDFDVTLTPQNSQMLKAPEGLATEPWVVAGTKSAHMAQVGVDGSKIYVKGIMSVAPEAWVEGNIDGNKVTFEVGQFLGQSSDMHYAYLFGGEVRYEFVEDYGDYANVTYATRSITFDYDAQAKALTNCTGIVTSPTLPAVGTPDDQITITSSMILPTIRYVERDPNSPPMPPQNISFAAYDDMYGYGYVDFDFLNMDANGYVLPSADLYYRVFFNNKPHVFYPDEYQNVTEPMTDVPYDFSDLYDFDVMGYDHTFYYFADGLDFIGIQTVYRPEGGRELMSPIVSFPVSNRITAAGADSRTVSSTEYFDLQGRPVANPAAGLYIVRTNYTDGTTSVAKSLIK